MWIVQKNKIWYNEAKWVSSKNASEKITTLHNDFGIDLTQEGEGDLAVMCNLGEGIYEDGLMKGREEGKKEGKLEFALELLKDGMSLEKVAKMECPWKKWQSIANYHCP